MSGSGDPTSDVVVLSLSLPTDIYKMSRVSRWEGHQKRIKSRLEEIWSGCWRHHQQQTGIKRKKKFFSFLDMCHRRTICLDSVKAPEILYGVAGWQTIDQTTTIQPFCFRFFFFGVWVTLSYQLRKEGSECFICVVTIGAKIQISAFKQKHIFDYYC